MAKQQPNRLIHEASPYLQQHAHNPVEWYPWGDEALARAEDRPILLSIGYSACHWCHVMERESFEDEGIAALMNQSFVNIKVDREERPDLDHIYQTAVQLMGGQGGWPLTVFLTPEAQPFYGGTYFPPEDRSGLPAFPRVLQAVHQFYRDRKEELTDNAKQLLQALHETERLKESSGALSDGLIDQAARALIRRIDPVHGGFGRAPKFPSTMNLSLLLRYHRARGDEPALRMLLLTLRGMADGGIYDHVGGGFHRYSVDDRWRVPHFEKMLYDNALLTSLYLEAFQVTRDPEWARVARETLEYVRHEMLSPAGGFYATQDADSEGVEGKFYTWTRPEILGILGPEAEEVFSAAYGVSEAGNFEDGRNILHRRGTLAQVAKRLGRAEEEVRRTLEEARRKLGEVREGRVRPFRDEKILTSWNGLMISACARAGQVLGGEGALEMAARSAEFIDRQMVREGRLLRVYKDGRAKGNGFLDDYAFFAAALLDLYEATFEPRYLQRALELHRATVEQFWDEAGGGFFFTGRDHEALVHRPRSITDHSIPSGTSVATQNLLRVYHLTGEEVHRARAERVLRIFREPMEQNPFGFGNMLGALDFSLRGPTEVVLVGRRGSAEVQHLLRIVHRHYLPNKVLFLGEGEGGAGVPGPALAAGRDQVDGRATAYVCRRFACSAPVTAPEELERLLVNEGRATGARE